MRPPTSPLMDAVALRDGTLRLKQVPRPDPGPGQLALRPVTVGVCGSDLSAWQHTEQFLQASRDAGMTTYLFDPDRDLVLGHEFVGLVEQVGPGVDGYAVGDMVVGLPYAVDADGQTRTVGYSTAYPGALSETVVVQAAGQIPVPPDVPPWVAVLTEPLTTGTSAVVRSRITPPASTIVTGCGTVGLGVIATLRERGIHPIIASDPSSTRRELARRMGAHVVIDPGDDQDPFAAWRAAGAAEPPVVFEASGAHGLLGRLMARAPMFTRIVVVGTGMLEETVRPVLGIYKNLTIEFCGGPGPGQDYRAELVATLDRLRDGRIDGRTLVTGWCGLDGVPDLFEALRPGNPSAVEHLKVVVVPSERHPKIGSPADLKSLDVFARSTA
ncbi:alcohol dehydrogenase catalytic domain-containing protein [Intrasporangium sp.]|uniref:alcohol dehydrogenase catalytic domain-containing protein n=1 Tax=Intrasporangium sp. TaxID=1925024 RepID=UPI0032216BEC